MTPEQQVEFHVKLSDSRYDLINKLDALLHKELAGGTHGMPYNVVDYNALEKIAGVRIHLFREILEMASLTQAMRFSPVGGAGSSDDYRSWVELVNKGAQDEQKEDKK